MVRSGLVLLVLVVSLAGCAPSPIEVADPSPTPNVAATCPAGLAEALETHLAAQPVAGVLPLEARVREFPEPAFASALVTSIVGCVFTTELVLPGGESMLQIFGIVDGLDEDGVIEVARTAGWEQPFPDTEPGVWQDPADPQQNLSIYPRGAAATPALGFAGWADYLDPDEVLLLSSIR